jgi:hypothetical protein
MVFNIREDTVRLVGTRCHGLKDSEENLCKRVRSSVSSFSGIVGLLGRVGVYGSGFCIQIRSSIG